jgi:hypothetical protein
MIVFSSASCSLNADISGSDVWSSCHWCRRGTYLCQHRRIRSCDTWCNRRGSSANLLLCTDVGLYRWGENSMLCSQSILLASKMDAEWVKKVVLLLSMDGIVPDESSDLGSLDVTLTGFSWSSTPLSCKCMIKTGELLVKFLCQGGKIWFLKQNIVCPHR